MRTARSNETDGKLGVEDSATYASGSTKALRYGCATIWRVGAMLLGGQRWWLSKEEFDAVWFSMMAVCNMYRVKDVKRGPMTTKKSR